MSGTVIITKYSTSTGSPATNALAVGELAYSFNSDRLFIGETSGGDVVARIIGGQLYTDMMDHTAGTLTASSAIIVDANSKIDHLIVDNLDFNLNHITSTNTNGNINITPNGSGSVVIDGLNYPQADGSASQFLQTDGSGNLSFATVISSFTVAAESGTADVVNTGETLTFAAGAGIDTVVSANTITISGEDATTTNKGVANFNSGHFAVSSGEVTIAADGIDNTLIDDGSGNLSFSAPASSSLTLSADSGTNDNFNTGETLTFTGGNGIDTTVTDNVITFAAEVATSSNQGVATFATADFDVTSGDVTVKALGISNAQLAGSIANGKLANTTVAYGGVTLALGTADTTPAFDLSDATAYPTSSLVGTITNAQLAGSIANGKLANSTITIGSDSQALGTTITDLNGITSLDVDNVTIDGNAISTSDSNGNLSLAKNQSTAAQNGFYKVTTVGTNSSNWVLTRTPDADAASELTAGAFTFAEEGTLNGDNGYVMSTNGAVTLGTTAITFEQFSGAGQISAGDGLTKNGNTIDAVGTADKITVSADAITIASTYIGQTSLTTLGTITAGTWTATDVAVAHGGTGASTALAARTNLGVGEGDSPMLTAVNVGHASDSTLARASAGDLSIEGNIIYRAAGTDVPITDGGTGVSSHTGNAYWVSNAAGTALSYITGTQYQHLGFTSGGVPQASSTIDGGTF